MNPLLLLPPLFLLGACTGGQVNRGIYRLAWNRRSIGPWSAPHEQAPPRHWYDRIPIVGWWFLRRESDLHGSVYWLRPMFIELATGIGFAALYWHEVILAGVFVFPGFHPSLLAIHIQYFSHLVLIGLMIVATFVDFDEQTIPDAITIPGAAVGLLLVAVLPQSRPFATVPDRQGLTVDHLHMLSGTALAGLDWPAWLNGPRGLAVGMACFMGWWLAVLPWFWTTRRGWIRGLGYLVASARRGAQGFMSALAGAGATMILTVWWLGGEHWEALLSALVGLAAGGGLIWAVRILGSRALGQEAMGFGDVTLMAMIGASTGWQATLVIFFLAPLAALFISVTQWLLTRRKDIAFGPYLCLAAVCVIECWGSIWEPHARLIFSMGWFVPCTVMVCLGLMWAMLTILRLTRRR